MNFKVQIYSAAKKNLKKIYSTPYYKQVKKALLEMKENPFVGDVKQLKAFKYAQYRKRVGNYRILFDFDVEEKIVHVFRIRHRKDAYS